MARCSCLTAPERLSSIRRLTHSSSPDIPKSSMVRIPIMMQQTIGYRRPLEKGIISEGENRCPVFGNYRGGIGSVGIVDSSGQYDAKINATPSGIRAIPMYRTSVEFLYRKQDVIFIGTSGQIPFFQAEKIKGDRKVSYLLLQGEDAGYVGMAKAYRGYLQKEQNVKAIEQKGVPLNIRLYGGLERSTKLSERLSLR